MVSITQLLVIRLISTGIANAEVLKNLRHEHSNEAALYEDASQFAATMLARVNEQRAANGLRALCINTKLMAASERQANDMATNNFVSHTGSDGSTMSMRVTATGYKWIALGENVAAGQTSVNAVMSSWMNSPGHRANILGDYNMMGTAFAFNSSSTYKNYWIQNFGKSTTEKCDYECAEDIESSSPLLKNETAVSRDNSTEILLSEQPCMEIAPALLSH